MPEVEKDNLIVSVHFMVRRPILMSATDGAVRLGQKSVIPASMLRMTVDKKSFYVSSDLQREEEDGRAFLFEFSGSEVAVVETLRKSKA
ncbi:hypothetical protein [Salipiger mucosus]|uniref:Uncharacterized protein n=1 Tax=Salipiger mucosus DSM 16094 TaxID=1123237 RepID=S9QWH0_9RHOB|nr:hypothetical protein [Salipiger mucosus]EPX83942.1 hypothetical protein Salmuc_01717 [Salipiger mucosus DSM 16094]